MVTWEQRIAEAAERKKFTDKDRALAESFSTCAVGEKYDGHIWDSDGDRVFSPAEEEMGMNFWRAVRAQNIPEAKRVYEEIQKA